MNILPNKIPAAILVLAACLISCDASGNWQDKSAGQPIVENLSAKDMGADGFKWISLQDKSGRLFVGSKQLQVFDGQAWESFPVPNTAEVRALAFGEDGRLWAGAINEVGYFEEESLGRFKYHSLVGLLPEADRQISDVWACSVMGRDIVFFCKNKILRWDGSRFQVWSYDGKPRLFPLQLNGEPWFQHLGTGLYRMTDKGPKLVIPAAQLPLSGILGLAQDNEGLVLIAAQGLYRPGTPPLGISSAPLSKFITDSQPTCFAILPEVGYAIGTLNGGIALATKSGELLRILDNTSGLPSRAILSIRPGAGGYAWCTTPDGIFHLEATGHATRFDADSGLKSQAIVNIHAVDSHLYALTQDAVFDLVASETQEAYFEPLAQLKAAYNHALAYRGGLLLARHGGMDFFDGENLRPLFALVAQGVYYSQALRAAPDSFYLSEKNGIGLLVRHADGTFTHTSFQDLPTPWNSLLEDPQDRLWLGTEGSGAYTFAPGTKRLSPINDPATGTPFLGRAFVLGSDQHILIFNKRQVLIADMDGSNLSLRTGTPPIDLVAVRPIPGRNENLVAFNQPAADRTPTQGLGILTVDRAGNPQWQELTEPALKSIGFIHTMEFTSENNRLILWIGGTDGLLRLDYDSIAPAQNPDTPLIRLDPAHSSQPGISGELVFPFQDNHLSFRIFTGDYGRSKSWLLESRLGNGQSEWSAPSSRRFFEFASLAEGEHRFEVRTVDPAGRTSEPAVFTFRILPPWYRSGWAYAAYLAIFGVAVLIVIRIRERQIRRRNQELEKIVAIRTEELVKASAAKDEFLAGISHEIRNPMNGVIGIAETFRTDALDADSRHKFGLLRQCASHLSSLLEDVLDFSRVQAGMVEIETKPFHLAELVESVAAITATESTKRGIPVEIAVSPAVPAELIGDPRRIRQILLNFVGNALKFSGRGQVSVTIWCKSVSPAQAEVIFAVSDEGPGISAEEQKRLFTRFERGAAAQQGRVPGTGLGLALCKGLAEKMGGRIWLESEQGEGSCFYFSATFATPEKTDQPAAAAGHAEFGLGQSALVVDDEEYNRIAMTDLLEALGFSVQTAADGLAALTLAGRQAFDVVFLDFDLPGMSGLDASRGIRALPGESARALIVATTAFTTPEKRAQCLAAGMDTFLGKPVTRERLHKVLSAALDERTVMATPEPEPAPADPLANLRLITKRKGTAFADELALYLSELGVELEQLHLALQQENAANTGHYAHLLYGRCAFIAEAELEQTLRNVEAAGANARWDEARTLARSVEEQLAGLRLRLASAALAAPPASGR